MRLPSRLRPMDAPPIEYARTEDDDYFGAAVQLARRVCDRAEPGQVLVSNVVRELCAGKLFQFEDQGATTLKGFPEPVRLFVVGEGAEP